VFVESPPLLPKPFPLYKFCEDSPPVVKLLPPPPPPLPPKLPFVETPLLNLPLPPPPPPKA
jgi:hypothetical protein